MNQTNDDSAWFPVSVPYDRRYGETRPVWYTQQELDERRRSAALPDHIVEEGDNDHS